MSAFKEKNKGTIQKPFDVILVCLLLILDMLSTRNLVYLTSRHLLVEVNKGNTRTMCKICSTLLIQTPEQRRKTLAPVSSAFIVDFEQVNVSWVFFISTHLSRKSCKLFPQQKIDPHSFNLFHTTGLFLCPLKTSENQGSSDVSRGYGKKPVT